MIFRVICGNTCRTEYANEPVIAMAMFDTAGADSPGKLISGSEVSFHLRSTLIDQLGWVKAGEEYEIEIRPVK